MPGAHRGVVSRRGPQPTGSYPHAHIQGNLVWVTAQAGRDPGNGELVEGGMAGQMDRAISNLEAMDEVYARRFPLPLPVRTSWGVNFLAAEPGTELVRVQIDCVAAVG